MPVNFLTKTFKSRGFLGGSVVKDLPASAGDVRPGRSHMLRSK